RIDAAALEHALRYAARGVDPELERPAAARRDLHHRERAAALVARAEAAHRGGPTLRIPPGKRGAIGRVARRLDRLLGTLHGDLAGGVLRPRRVAVEALGAAHRPEPEAPEALAGRHVLPRVEGPREAAGLDGAVRVEGAHGVPRRAA